MKLKTQKEASTHIPTVPTSQNKGREREQVLLEG